MRLSTEQIVAELRKRVEEIDKVIATLTALKEEQN